MEKSILTMEGITKVYPNGFVALKNVELSVNEGEIHALLGENGAGKSTLMKVLFGIEKPEEGKILYHGKEIKIDNPLTAIDYEIGMVHQHFMLVPSLSVASNMVLGMEPKKFGMIDYKKAVEMTREVSKKYNLEVDPEAIVEDLSVGLKQKVEILKALLRGAKILILDEPTAVLTPQETKELFVELKKLRDMGHTVIFISHKLNEIIELCDRLTVLRMGKYLGCYEVAEMDERDISKLVVGRDVVLTIDKKEKEVSETLLKVKNLSYKGIGGKLSLDDISLSVRAGEILGVAGVEGNGQKELSDIITGMLKYEQGSVTIMGQEIKRKSIMDIRNLKVAHISDDRMTYGAVGDATIMENIMSIFYRQKRFVKRGLFKVKELSEFSKILIKDYLVKCDDEKQEIKMLSGGNIQKVIIAREFSSDPKLIISNQPTRGIDVGASDFVRRKLVDLRDDGKGILLISADLNEILEVSDSVIVMNEGRIVAYFQDAKKVTEEQLGEYMLALKEMTPEEVSGCVYE